LCFVGWTFGFGGALGFGAGFFVAFGAAFDSALGISETLPFEADFGFGGTFVFGWRNVFFFFISIV
jgi:hypothetical protein